MFSHPSIILSLSFCVCVRTSDERLKLVSGMKKERRSGGSVVCVCVCASGGGGVVGWEWWWEWGECVCADGGTDHSFPFFFRFSEVQRIMNKKLQAQLQVQEVTTDSETLLQILKMCILIHCKMYQLWYVFVYKQAVNYEHLLLFAYTVAQGVIALLLLIMYLYFLQWLLCMVDVAMVPFALLSPFHLPFPSCTFECGKYDCKCLLCRFG